MLNSVSIVRENTDEKNVYRMDGFAYWSDPFGNPFNPKVEGVPSIDESDLPAELRTLSGFPFENFSVRAFLAEYKGQYGIALEAEYDPENDGEDLRDENGRPIFYGYRHAEIAAQVLLDFLPKLIPGVNASILLDKGTSIPYQSDYKGLLTVFLPASISLKDYTLVGEFFGHIAWNPGIERFLHCLAYVSENYIAFYEVNGDPLLLELFLRDGKWVDADCCKTDMRTFNVLYTDSENMACVTQIDVPNGDFASMFTEVVALFERFCRERHLDTYRITGIVELSHNGS